MLGTTGAADKLAIIYNAGILSLISTEELHHINVGGNVRAPLVAEFQVRETGERFLFMVNHLYRSREDRRHEQAMLLNAWAEMQTLPVIAVGDYNFDWEVIGGEADHDLGYDLMTASGIWEWVRPSVLIKTQCSPDFNSVLDFTFVAGAARDWPASSEILETDPAYCEDDSMKSDHRPVLASFEVP